MLSAYRSTLYIVCNPDAGNCQFLSRQLVERILCQKDIVHQWITLEQLAALAAENTASHTLLVIGGDGTLHRVLNTIGFNRLEQFTIAVLPLGTGNDFARSLDIPLQVERALTALCQGTVTTVDVGLLNNRICFTCAISLGFGPSVTRHASRKLKALLGRWALYLGAMLTLGRPAANYRLRAWVDGQHEALLKTPHLVIGNAKTHGGGIRISPQADLQSQKLDLYYLKPYSLRQVPQMLFRFLRGEDHTRLAEVTHYQVSEMRLQLPSPMEVDVDGELYMFYRQLSVRVAPGKLKVLVPAGNTLNDKTVYHDAWQPVGRDSRAS